MIMLQRTAKLKNANAFITIQKRYMLKRIWESLKPDPKYFVPGSLPPRIPFTSRADRNVDFEFDRFGILPTGKALLSDELLAFLTSMRAYSHIVVYSEYDPLNVKIHGVLTKSSLVTWTDDLGNLRKDNCILLSSSQLADGRPGMQWFRPVEGVFPRALLVDNNLFLTIQMPAATRANVHAFLVRHAAQIDALNPASDFKTFLNPLS